ncbi:SH3 domain-containing protein [Fulvimarina sp. MAC8]
MPRTHLSKFRSAGRIMVRFALAGAILAASLTAMPAVSSAVEVGRYSKLPLPRYVSLKSSRVNLRNGPGREHKVNWLYLKSGLPVEIIQEFDHWRKIRDSDGTEGWVYHSLLSGERTAIAAPWLKGKNAFIDVYANPAKDAPLIVQMEPGVISKVEKCNAGWCEIAVSERVGFVEQTDIWGVYPDEPIEN